MTSTSVAPPAPRAATTTALLWVGIALASFSFVAVAGREASRGMTTLELMAYRSWLSLAVLMVIIRLSSGGFAGLATARPGLHVARGGVHFVAQFVWLKALTLIPLAQLFALEFTSPLWVALLAPLVLGERLTPWRIGAGLIGFCGVIVTLGGAVTTLDTGTALALTSAVGFAGSMLATKMLTRTESTLTILFYMFALQTAVTLPLLATGLQLPNQTAALWAVAVAFAGLAAHFSLTKAFAAADAMVVAPMDFLRLPLIAVVGALLYQEAVDPRVLIGGAVIILGNLFNIWGERRRTRSHDATA